MSRSPDPIFAAIAAARKAFADIDWSQANEVVDAAAIAAEAVENAAYATKPTTFAGALALLEYIAERAKECDDFLEPARYAGLANVAAAMCETAGKTEARS
jgi:hypothetical protein